MVEDVEIVPYTNDDSLNADDFEGSAEDLSTNNILGGSTCNCPYFLYYIFLIFVQYFSTLRAVE